MIFNSRKLKRGGFSIALTAIFIAIVVLLNVIINTLLARFDVRVDMTENRIYSIEQSTAEFIRSLDDTIHFYFCSEEDVFRNLDRSADYFSQVVEIANRFAENNRNFTISFINRTANPRFSAEYGGNLTDDSIVIVSENTGCYRIIDGMDYMVVSFWLEGRRISQQEAMFGAQLGAPVEIDVRSGAEQAFLSAIMSVSDMSPVRVAFAEGFGEGVVTNSEFLLYTPMASLLEKNSYLIETVDLFLNDTIDPDIDYLVLFTPTYDYSEEAIRAIITWLDNRAMYGKTLLYFPAPADIRDTPNLDAFLAEWGIKVEEGFAIQRNPSFTSAGSNGFEQIVNHDGMFSAGIDTPVVGNGIRPLTPLFERTPSFTTSVFMQSFPGTYFHPFSLFNPEIEISADEAEALMNNIQILDMGIMSTMRRLENMDEFMSHVIVLGSPDFFSHLYLASEHHGNARLLLNIFNVLSGRDENHVVITPKSFQMTRFEITKAEADRIALTFTIILPAIIIAAGLVVFFRRRYK